MKTYEVELRRVSYITLTIEAENEEDAEEKAWAEVEGRDDHGDASWGLGYVSEIEKKGE